MSFCEFCGSKLEENQVCNCAAAERARTLEAAPVPPQPEAPPNPTQTQEPPRQEAAVPPPQPQPFVPQQEAVPPQAAGGYPPPPPQQPYPPTQQQGAYPPPPQYGAPPQQQPYASPLGQSPYSGQPGYYGTAAPAYLTPNQVNQTFGAVKSTLGSFLKDPYGMAAQGGSLSVSVALILLGVQVVAFFLMVLADLAKVDFWGTNAAFWFKTLFLGAIGIALLYGSLFVAGKIGKITLNPKTLLSAQALSSLPLSVMYLLIAVFTLVFDGNIGSFFQTLVSSLGAVASILLLEVSLRAVMPAGVGNMARLVALTCAYAVTNALSGVLPRDDRHPLPHLLLNNPKTSPPEHLAGGFVMSLAG